MRVAFVKFDVDLSQCLVVDRCKKCGSEGGQRSPSTWEWDQEAKDRTCELCGSPHLERGSLSFPTAECVRGLSAQIAQLREDLDHNISVLKDVRSEVERMLGRRCC